MEVVGVHRDDPSYPLGEIGRGGQGEHRPHGLPGQCHVGLHVVVVVASLLHAALGTAALHRLPRSAPEERTTEVHQEPAEECMASRP
ncbi:hypothetical protein ABT116_03695 [Streptomyces sp. NPDC002130]|uniref:hypothetical protein n=1 Tax=Streptomyces sp. NPDC002130 TaxID=3155568 RepID=UPI003330042D